MITLNDGVKCIHNRYLLNHVNFTFEENTNYVINGASGAGKTTLLNIISGYDKLDGGSISVKTGASIQYLFQEPLLFSNLTVEENMRIKLLSKREDDKEYSSRLIETMLSVFFVEDLIDKKICTLSGGEKQRVELAQILLFSPDILLLDEPTSSLDPANKANIIKMINEAFPQTMKIIVSHEQKEIFDGYKHLCLFEGRLSDEP
jgi:ABC-type multidrug transport system ATPase subunit